MIAAALLAACDSYSSGPDDGNGILSGSYTGTVHGTIEDPLDLIATGFAEAATAVNQAVHWIYPEKKVNPGHSSNMEVFGQKDD